MSLSLAIGAKKTIWDKWGTYIPDSLFDTPMSDIVNFHVSPQTYGIVFAATFIRTFRSANNIPCRAGDSFAPNVAAFVTADERNTDREIHVHPSALLGPQKLVNDREALLAHEYIHWLSHPNFYPDYYKVGGAHPFRVEGFTEWLMMQCYPPNTVEVVYVSEYEKTRAWLQADTRNEGRLLQFIFQGVATDLGNLNP